MAFALICGISLHKATDTIQVAADVGQFRPTRSLNVTSSWPGTSFRKRGGQWDKNDRRSGCIGDRELIVSRDARIEECQHGEHKPDNPLRPARLIERPLRQSTKKAALAPSITANSPS